MVTAATMQADDGSGGSSSEGQQRQGGEEGIDLTFGKEYTEAALWELEWLPYLLRLALARSSGAFESVYGWVVWVRV